ncbi:helix-turn-helix domain-containing protein [Dechloromonas denitrificans]|uniref:helix-turn-helix domain-containing protein n=1 Tax=Dechloromonas denitrificans TaxID=281362 RepID=UPI001CF84D11
MVTKARVLRAATIFRERGISQSEVAEIVGASQPQISRILKGDGIRSRKSLISTARLVGRRSAAACCPK